jgi:hypothetical protein
MSSLISLPGSECCLMPALWLGGATQGLPGSYVCDSKRVAAARRRPTRRHLIASHRRGGSARDKPALMQDAHADCPGL